MNIFDIIKLVAIILTIIVMVSLFQYYYQEKLSSISQVKVAAIGFIANLFDTIGIGSFAVIVALRRLFGVMPDDVKLIGTMNIQAMITSLAQALIFLHFVHLDLATLMIAIFMISLGGFVSGFMVVRIDKKLVRQIMLTAFAITGVLLLLTQFHVIKAARGTDIHGIKLVLFAILMLISGALPAFGVGYYALIQTSIFVLGVNPIIAFPIMACASAYQMPLTSMTFIPKQKFYPKSTLLLAVFGLIGVFIAAPLISKVDQYTLKWILFGVVVYNIITLAKTRKLAA